MAYHVTEIIDGCSRRHVLDRDRKKERLKEPHLMTARGIVVHRFVENYLKSGRKSIAYDEVRDEMSNEMFDAVMREEIDISPESVEEYGRGTVEKRFVITLDDGTEVLMTPDLYTEDTLVDWKTSLKKSKKHVMQVSVYVRLLERIDGKKRDAVVVYLRTEKKEKVAWDETEEYYEQWLQKLHKFDEEVKRGGVPNVGFRCVYCPYRHICSGV